MTTKELSIQFPELNSSQLKMVERLIREAQIAELSNALLAEPDRSDADFASQMLAVVTYVKDRLTALQEQSNE